MMPTISAANTTCSPTSTTAMDTYLADPAVTCLSLCNSIPSPWREFNAEIPGICTGGPVTFTISLASGQVTGKLDLQDAHLPLQLLRRLW